MRTARLVGPTTDGTSLVLVTEDGEELTVTLDPADPAVRSLIAPTPEPPRAVEAEDLPSAGSSPPAAGRAGPEPAGPEPASLVRRQPRRRETPMDTPLSPRDIQTRIRAGESLEDVVAGSGADAERIERFAAPVLAEREHLALTALGSSVRRRGEASGHRPLRAVVAERLLAQGVDADEVTWDAWKRDDAQWQLSADYDLQGETRHAEFRFDPQGRFSVAEDDEARWLAGEAPSPVAASIDRDDELALVRATREPSHHDEPAEAAADPEETQALVREVAEELGAVLQVVPPAELSREELEELAADDPEADADADATGDDDAGDGPIAGGLDPGARPDDGTSDAEPTLVDVRDEAAEPTVAVVRHLTRLTVEVDEVDTVEVVPQEPGEAEAEARSALDTLYEMLGGHTEESPRVYAGLSDAAAVPEVDEHEFEPPAAVQVPAEPEPSEPERTAPEQADPEPPEDEHAEDEHTGDEPGNVLEVAPDAALALPAGPTGDPVPAPDDLPEPLVPSPGASRRPGRRKRAAVPTWDEIMFGGPKPD